MSLDVASPPWRAWMLGYGVVLPFLTSAAALLASWPLWRRAASPKGTWPLALALGAGYAAGHAGIEGWRPFPPREASDWLWYFVLAAVALSLLDAQRFALSWLRGMAGALLWLAVVWILPPASLRGELGLGGWTALLAGLTVAGWLFAALLAVTARRLPGALVPLILLIVSAATTAVLFFGYSFKYTQLAGVLTAALLSILPRSLCKPPAPMATMPVLVLLPGLWLLSYFHAYDPPPIRCFALLAAATLTGAIGLLPGMWKLCPWQRCLLCGLASAALAWWAVVTAHRARREDDQLLRSPSLANAVTMKRQLC